MKKFFILMFVNVFFASGVFAQEASQAFQPAKGNNPFYLAPKGNVEEVRKTSSLQEDGFSDETPEEMKRLLSNFIEKRKERVAKKKEKKAEDSRTLFSLFSDFVWGKDDDTGSSGAKGAEDAGNEFKEEDLDLLREILTLVKEKYNEGAVQKSQKQGDAQEDYGQDVGEREDGYSQEDYSDDEQESSNGNFRKNNRVERKNEGYAPTERRFFTRRKIKETAASDEITSAEQMRRMLGSPHEMTDEASAALMSAGFSVSNSQGNEIAVPQRPVRQAFPQRPANGLQVSQGDFDSQKLLNFLQPEGAEALTEIFGALAPLVSSPDTKLEHPTPFSVSISSKNPQDFLPLLKIASKISPEISQKLGALNAQQNAKKTDKKENLKQRGLQEDFQNRGMKNLPARYVPQRQAATLRKNTGIPVGRTISFERMKSGENIKTIPKWEDSGRVARSQKKSSVSRQVVSLPRRVRRGSAGGISRSVPKTSVKRQEKNVALADMPADNDTQRDDVSERDIKEDTKMIAEYLSARPDLQPDIPRGIR